MKDWKQNQNSIHTIQSTSIDSKYSEWLRIILLKPWMVINTYICHSLFVYGDV